MAANTFGNISPTAVTGNAFSDTLPKTEVLSPSQQNSASKLLEKIETTTSSESAKSDDAKQSTPKEDVNIISESAQKTDVDPSKGPKVTSEVSAASKTDGVMSKLDAAINELSKTDAVDSPLAASTAISSSESSSGESSSDAKVSTPDKPLEEPNSAATRSGDQEQPETATDSLMTKLQDAMKNFAPTKADKVETPDPLMAGSSTVSIADSVTDNNPESVQKPKIEEPKTETEKAGSQVDGLMTKLDEAMSKFNDAIPGDAGPASVEQDAGASAGNNPDESKTANNGIVAATTAESKIADEGVVSGTESSPFDNIMAKLEASMEEKEAKGTVQGSLVDSADSSAPTIESSSEKPSTAQQLPAEGGSTTNQELSSKPVQPNSESSELQENTKPEVDESMPSVDITAASPETPLSEGGAPTSLSEKGTIAETKQDTPTLKEDDVFPTKDENFSGESDGVVEPAKDEGTAPILTVPAVQTPSMSTTLPDIRIPGLENMDPAIYQSAAAIAAGAVLVGILASVGDDTATMPVGKKEEKSDYLDGLTRSSSSTDSKPPKPPSYVESLSAKPSQPFKASGAPGTGSYLENLSQPKQTSPGYSMPIPSNNGAQVIPPKQASSTPPLSVTNASQAGSVSRPPEDPRASIPKSQFSPPSEKSKTTTEPPKLVSRQRVAEPAKNVPGLSYLESMATGAPQKIPPPVKRNTISNVANIDTSKAVPGLSYLERMAEATASNGSGPPNGASMGQSTPNGANVGKPVPSGSSPQFQSFSDSLSRSSNGQTPPNGAGPSKATPPAFQNNGQTESAASSPFTSFSNGLSRQNGQTELPTASDRMTQTNVGSKADQPKPKAPAGFGSYLDSL